MTDRVAIALAFYNDRNWRPSVSEAKEDRMVNAYRAATRVQRRCAYQKEEEVTT